MKKNFLNWMMAVALVATPMVFTACGDDDDENDITKDQGGAGGDQGDSDVIIDFEDAKLNADKYWIGDNTGVETEGQWGSTWACTYTEGVAKVNTTFGDYYWLGFAISAVKGTSFVDPYSVDQYKNVVGEAYSGENFLVAQNFVGNESITFSKPVTLKDFYYTNSAYAVNSILNGDDYSGPRFEDTDWFKFTVVALCADGTSVTADIDLAKDGDYVKEWKAASATVDLKNFKNVVELTFTFSGSRVSNGYLSTPAYVCLDKFVVEPTK